MDLEQFKEHFSGREGWRTFNNLLYFIIYCILIIVVFLLPMYFWWFILGLSVFLPSYIAYFQYHIREMEKQEKGNKVIEGWITHAFGMGERIELNPIKFERAEKLSPEDLETIKEYVKISEELANAAKIETGLDKFKPRQLTYKEIIEKETLNKEEMEELINEERAEKEVFEQEFEEITQKETNPEDE